MALSIPSWIATTILNHDKEHGADLSVHIISPVLCQLVEFTSFRTFSQPQRLITAVVSDNTHRVAVAFDAPATDSYERSKAGEDPERLTGCLRSIIRLNEYSLSVVPPRQKQRSAFTGTDLPSVLVLVHRWDVVQGDRNEPVYYPRALEVGAGTGKLDELAKDVLRKWWLGDSQRETIPSAPPEGKPVKRDDSVEGSIKEDSVKQTRPMVHRNASAGPSRPRRDTSAPPDDDLPRLDRASMRTVRQLVIETARQGKPLPAWLFTAPSPAQRAALDQIEVFGLDLYAVPDEAEAEPEEPASLPQSNGHSEESRSNGHSQRSNGHANSQSNGHSSGSQLSNGHREASQHEFPVRPSHSQIRDAWSRSQSELHEAQPPEPRPVSTERHPSLELSAPPHTQQPQPAQRFRTPAEESDDDDSIPIRPIARATQARARVFASSPPPPILAQSRASSQPTGETDDEDLSEYERSARRGPPRSPSPRAPSPPPVEMPPPDSQSQSQPKSQPQSQPQSLPIPTGESITKSQSSGSFNLARITYSVPAAPSSPIASAPVVSSSAPPANYVLVHTTTDESLPLERDDNSPPDPPPPELTTLMMEVVRKRPRTSDMTRASAEADDEASLERAPKRRRSAALPPPVPVSAEEVPAEEVRDEQEEEEEYVEEAQLPHPAVADEVMVKEEEGEEEEEGVEEDGVMEEEGATTPPPNGQRTPPTTRAPRRYLLVSEAAALILPGYRADLTDFPVPGLSSEWVEAARERAIESQAARERRARLEGGASGSGQGSGRRER